MSPDNSHARHRRFRLVLAVGTSLVSKGGTIILQLVAIPVAVRVLGLEMFGVYAALTTAISFLTLTGVGVGPGLTRAIARAHAADDRTDERSYFMTALTLLTVAALIAAGLIYALLHTFPATTLFGEGFRPYENLVRSCAPLVAGLVFLEVLLSSVERTQAGYQEMHRANLAGAIGNALGGVLLLTGISYWPNIQFLMISVLGVLSICRLGNGLLMVLGRRSYLLGGFSCLSKSKARDLISDGIAFTAAQSVAPLLHREGGKLLASHFGGPAAAGIFAVLNQVSTLLGGVVVMFTGPLWPALMDAAHRRDYAWFETARRRVWAAVLAYAGTAALVLGLAGTWLVDLWLGGQVSISQPVLVAFAFYYVAGAWSHVNYVFLMGLGVITAPAVISVVEAVGALLLGWWALPWAGMAGLLWGMTASMILMSAWLFPTLLLNRLRLCKSQEIPGTAITPPA